MSFSLFVAGQINGSIRRRVLLTPRCTFCSAGKKQQRRRRRGKLPLAPSKKDRIRTLEKKPEPSLFEMSSMDTLGSVGDTVESRLTQAQEFVYKLWGAPSKARPERAALNMDGRWWFWNILLVATPGILIAAYCEFKAKPEMHEILARLNEEQRARILGDALLEEREQDIVEMDEEEVHRLQESVNEELALESDENLTLLALKQRLDALESQLYKKDKQLNHLRNYQLERSQQSGVQNRIEDKMVAEWKSQSNQQSRPRQANDVDNDSDTLSERIKEAVMHGIGENLETKKQAVQRYGEKCLEYGRGLFSVQDKSAADESESRQDATTNNTDVVQAVTQAAAHTMRAANTVSSSVSNNDANDLTRAASEAADAAVKASHAAQAAATASTSQAEATASKQEEVQPGFVSRQWNRLFHRRKDDSEQQSGDESSG